MMKLLCEPHSFKRGNDVHVYARTKPSIIYSGVIHDIIRQPFQKGIENSPMLDYFYITFDTDTYHDLLMKGLMVIHDGKQKVVGSIQKNAENKVEKITVDIHLDQYGLGISSLTDEITIEEIEAILVWRVAFVIDL